MLIIGYARTSTTDQTAGLADQVKTLTDAGCMRVFTEHASATNADRTQLQACLMVLGQCDTLIVTKPDRLARSVPDMLRITDDLSARGVRVRILSMDIDTGTPTGKLLLTMLAAVAEWERAIMKERQRAGIEAAQRAGKYQGRMRALTAATLSVALEMDKRGVPRAEIARRLGIGRSTLYRSLADAM